MHIELIKHIEEEYWKYWIVVKEILLEYLEEGYWKTWAVDLERMQNWEKTCRKYLEVYLEIKYVKYVYDKINRQYR